MGKARVARPCWSQGKMHLSQAGTGKSYWFRTIRLCDIMLEARSGQWTLGVGGVEVNKAKSPF